MEAVTRTIDPHQDLKNAHNSIERLKEEMNDEVIEILEVGEPACIKSLFELLELWISNPDLSQFNKTEKTNTLWRTGKIIQFLSEVNDRKNRMDRSKLEKELAELRVKYGDVPK